MSIHILEALEAAGRLPALVVTTPDKPAGRKLILTPNVVKTWAQSRNIPVLDPAKLDEAFIKNLRGAASTAKNISASAAATDLFIIASYGKIIPQAVLDIPKHKSLNVHPSLLPEYRGASPLQSAILDDRKTTGVSIMRIDALMDHGPVIAQKTITVTEWPVYEEFEKMMGHEGGTLLANILDGWVAGTIPEIEQDHTKATHTRKFTKEDGLIDLTTILAKKDPTPAGASAPAPARAAFLKIQAFHEWPTTYFFATKTAENNSTPDSTAAKIRVKITQASYRNNTLVIEKVIPEGKSEMTFTDFLSRGYRI